MYPNVESLLVGWLTAAFTGVKVKTELPPDVGTLVPAIRVVRVGGTENVLTIERPTIDVEYFALTRGAAYTGAEQVRHWLRTSLPGTPFDGGYVQRVNTVSAPAWRPWDDTNVRRVGASYQLILRTTP